MRAFFESLRPRQWVKNLFVAAALVFAKRLDDWPQALRALAALAIFCALSSAVYLWNDLVDLEKDRAHPKKKGRPIASGRLSIGAARFGAATLALVGLALATTLELNFAFVAAGYLLLNVAYSLWLKRVVYLDVLIIAGGFLLRMLGGAQAIKVWVSPYLFLCTLLLSCYFGFGKRAHELAAAGQRAEAQRSVLAAYSAGVLRAALWLTGAAALVSYVLYTLSTHTIEFFHSSKMVWTTPLAAYGLLRFGQLAQHAERHESPTDAMLRDWPFMLTSFMWGAAVVVIIYFQP